MAGAREADRSYRCSYIVCLYLVYNVPVCLSFFPPASPCLLHVQSVSECVFLSGWLSVLPLSVFVCICLYVLVYLSIHLYLIPFCTSDLSITVIVISGWMSVFILIVSVCILSICPDLFVLPPALPSLWYVRFLFPAFFFLSYLLCVSSGMSVCPLASMAGAARVGAWRARNISLTWARGKVKSCVPSLPRGAPSTSSGVQEP